MAARDSLLSNNPEVKKMALEALAECTDLQALGRKMLEALLNAAMSAKADEACNVAYGERDPGGRTAATDIARAEESWLRKQGRLLHNEGLLKMRFLNFG